MIQQAREPPAVVAAMGAYVPRRRMTNSEWAQYVDTSDEWIRVRTGIAERRMAADDESTATLARRAAERCLAAAKFSAGELRWVLVSTDTPEMWNPATAAFVQAAIGAVNAVALDVTGGCAGFVAALGLADARARLGEPVLLIGCELLSKAMDWSDRATAVLFGDGAGAALVLPGSEAKGLAVTSLIAGTDGRDANILAKPYGGTKNPLTPELVAAGHHHKIVMDGPYVFRNAVVHMTQAAHEALARAGLRLSDIACIVPHQANQRILDAVAKRLKVEPGKMYSNVARFANTGSASIGIALVEAMQQGLIERGQRLLTVAFGSGFSWAASVLTCTAVPPVDADWG